MKTRDDCLTVIEGVVAVVIAKVVDESVGAVAATASLLKCSAIGIGFNGAETNCGIAHILGILLMNSCNTDIFFSNYYHLQSVRFELAYMKGMVTRHKFRI